VPGGWAEGRTGGQHSNANTSKPHFIRFRIVDFKYYSNLTIMNTHRIRLQLRGAQRREFGSLYGQSESLWCTLGVDVRPKHIRLDDVSSYYGGTSP
jgi:hypothetical protein